MAEYKGKYKSVYTPGFEFETDYIAREAARDLMYHNQGPLTEYDLDDLPSADVLPVVRGRWMNFDRTENIMLSDSGFVSQEAYCSVCGVYLGGSAEYNVKGNFCSNCGAYMMEE